MCRLTKNIKITGQCICFCPVQLTKVMNRPKVYVGTYGKYNRGSIAGGWVSLLDCKDYRAFLSKCRALHRGERDPEYMIQDTEDFPDGLSCMEWLSEQDFNDVVEACKEQDGEQALSVAEQLRAVLLARLSLANNQEVPDYKACLDEFMQAAGKDPSNYRKWYVGAVKVHGHYYLIDKPSIDNRFCFHDEGPDYDFYCHLMDDKEKRLAEYFKSENLAKFDRLIDHIESGDTGGDNRLWFEDCYNDGLRIAVTTTQRWGDDNLTLCTPDERAIVLAAAKFGRAAMEKRLDAYLKRYGVSKIHTWTYWADA